VSTVEELTPLEVAEFRLLEQRLSMTAAPNEREALGNLLAGEFRDR
jgi:hypothetical protein